MVEGGHRGDRDALVVKWEGNWGNERWEGTVLHRDLQSHIWNR